MSKLASVLEYGLNEEAIEIVNKLAISYPIKDNNAYFDGQCKVMNLYATYGYRYINSFMRGQRLTKLKYWTHDKDLITERGLKRYVKAISKLMKPVNERMITYRAIRSGFTDVEVGKEYALDAFTSTSISPWIAYYFGKAEWSDYEMGKNGVMFEIVTTPDTRGILMRYEGELLLDVNQHIRVKSIHRDVELKHSKDPKPVPTYVVAEIC